VTVIQRFNSALGANPHFHTVFLDGVYTFPVGRAPVFHPTPAPTDEDVARVAAAVFRQVEARLAEREPGAVQRPFESSKALHPLLRGAAKLYRVVPVAVDPGAPGRSLAGTARAANARIHLADPLVPVRPISSAPC
jgi:hypothetical protein